jgi:hypothetical protein
MIIDQRIPFDVVTVHRRGLIIGRLSNRSQVSQIRAAVQNQWRFLLFARTSAIQL